MKKLKGLTLWLYQRAPLNVAVLAKPTKWIYLHNVFYMELTS